MDIDYNYNKFEKILGCPLCNSELNFDDLVTCENCKINYPKNNNGILSLISENQYGNKNDFNRAKEIIRYWDDGWEKRLKENDHLFLNCENEIKEWLEVVNERDRRRKGIGSLWTTEMDYEEIKDKIVLNIGCGAGGEIIKICGNGSPRQSILLDITKEAPYSAYKAMVKLGGFGTAIQGDSRYLPLTNESIEYTYTSGVLHHSNNIEKSIEEIYRVLKPGGIALIGLYSKSSIHFQSILIRSILHGNLSARGLKRFLNESTERDWRTQNKSNPNTDLYSGNQLKKMLGKFEIISIRKGDFAFEQIPYLKRMLGKRYDKYKNIKFFQNIEDNKYLSKFGMGIYLKIKKME